MDLLTGELPSEGPARIQQMTATMIHVLAQVLAQDGVC